MCLHTLKCGALILVYLSSETHNARVSECTSSAFTSNIFLSTSLKELTIQGSFLTEFAGIMI